MPRDPVRGKEALSQEAGDPGCRLPWGPLTPFLVLVSCGVPHAPLKIPSSSSPQRDCQSLCSLSLSPHPTPPHPKESAAAGA